MRSHGCNAMTRCYIKKRAWARYKIIVATRQMHKQDFLDIDVIGTHELHRKHVVGCLKKLQQVGKTCCVICKANKQFNTHTQRLHIKHAISCLKTLQYAIEACCRVFMPRGDLASHKLHGEHVSWRCYNGYTVSEPCCEHGRKYQDILKDFDTIFHEDLLEAQKIGIYSQNIVDISAIYRLMVINRRF